MTSRGFPFKTSRLLLAISLLLTLIPIGLVKTSSPVSASNAPMYAYTSATSGRWSFKIEASDTPTSITNVGDFAVQCGNMNLANNAGTKVYQSYNCNGSNKQITEIDVATNTFRNFTLAERTHTIAISPDDRYLYIADPYYTFKYDLSTTPPTYVLGGGRDDNNAGLNLGILPDGSKLYSASVQRNKVQVFNSSLALVATVTDASFAGLRWAVPNPSGSEVWVGFGSTYKIIRTSDDTISRTISATFGTGALPTFSQDGTKLYVTSGSGLLEISTVDGSVIRTFTGTGLANGTHASISPDGTYVYVASGATVGWVNLLTELKGSIALPTTTPADSSRTIAWAMPVAAPNISISNSTFSATIDSAVSNLYTLTNTGGNVASYSLTPSLPAGLTFNSSTGAISGTPIAIFSATTFTLTATNRGGTSTSTFSLEVKEKPVIAEPTNSASSNFEVANPTPSATTKSLSSKKSSGSSAQSPTPMPMASETPTPISSPTEVPELPAHNLSSSTGNNSYSPWLEIFLGAISIGALTIGARYLLKRK